MYLLFIIVTTIYRSVNEFNYLRLNKNEHEFNLRARKSFG